MIQNIQNIFSFTVQIDMCAGMNDSEGSFVIGVCNEIHFTLTNHNISEYGTKRSFY